MIRSQPVHEGPLVSLIRFDHPADRPHRDPAEEIAPHHAASFIEAGEFDLFHAGHRWRMGPAVLLVTHPGFAYRCAHAASRPADVSLSVQFSPRLVEQVQSSTGRRWKRSSPSAPLTNRLAYLRRKLVEAAARDDEAMAAVALAGDLLLALADDRTAPARLFRPGQLDWYARRVDAARAMLTERFAEPLSLETVAREAGMSLFHFCRVFRELVGVPPHRYLLRVRLAHAALRLEEGAGVTETCHATGFNNLSHFIRAFRRAHGVPPSRYAGRGRPRAPRDDHS